jgi:hypothetical protein
MFRRRAPDPAEVWSGIPGLRLRDRPSLARPPDRRRPCSLPLPVSAERAIPVRWVAGDSVRGAAGGASETRSSWRRGCRSHMSLGCSVLGCAGPWRRRVARRRGPAIRTQEEHHDRRTPVPDRGLLGRPSSDRMNGQSLKSRTCHRACHPHHRGHTGRGRQTPCRREQSRPATPAERAKGEPHCCGREEDPCALAGT